MAILAIVAVIVGMLGATAGFLALRTLGRLRRTLSLLHRDGRADSFVEVASRQAGEVDALRRDVARLRKLLDAGTASPGIAGHVRGETAANGSAAIGPAGGSGKRGEAAVPGTTGRPGDRASAVVRPGLGHVGLVRYDAFGGVAGRTSWSVALVDEGGDGLVLSAINGRTDTRCYAKTVTDGVSRPELSIEEEQAVAQAIGKDLADRPALRASA